MPNIQQIKIGNTTYDLKDNRVDDLQRALSNNTLFLSGCVYKKNTYIDASGVETTEQGYDLYRIPFKGCAAIYVKWDTSSPFYQSMNIAYVFAGIDSNDVVTRFSSANSSNRRYYIDTTNGEAMFVSYNEQSYLSICIKADKLNSVVVQGVSNAVSSFFLKSMDSVAQITELNAIKSKFFIAPTTNPNVNRYAQPSDNDLTLTFACKAGDRIVLTPVTGLSYYGEYADGTDGSVTRITDGYTAPNDGLFVVFGKTDNPYHCTYYPIKSIQIEYKHIINAPVSEALYSGMNAVAFGTSLTYRAQTTGGYLQYLPELSGITFENQGIGGAGLLSDGKIYTAIANYTSYASKDICTIEGFVNDWYHEASLGSYMDSESTASVCGRLRWCINYIYSQNQDITLFVILDHYGRALPAISEASTEVRGGKTQYEYYEELAKVCESLGVPVIKLYAKNRMSENTPQYFIDDIHPNARGAEQTAKTIWAGMKELYPSVK